MAIIVTNLVGGLEETVQMHLWYRCWNTFSPTKCHQSTKCIKDPAKDFTACEDFFVHVVEAHILTACMAVFKMESLEDQPTEEKNH